MAALTEHKIQPGAKNPPQKQFYMCSSPWSSADASQGGPDNCTGLKIPDLEHYFGRYQVWKWLLQTSRKQVLNIWGGAGNSVFVFTTRTFALKATVCRKDGRRSFVFVQMMGCARVNLNVSLSS